ncbi:MAG TPA: response regulator, partial [Pyrinomonadaceae bacterium]|nr:response regulator [Pyrinomonadaceae bacterium]
AGVLTDISMPFMDGPAMIRALRKMDPDVKIVAMSGLMNDEQSAELNTMKVHAHLQKPFTAEVLLNAVRKMLTGG